MRICVQKFGGTSVASREKREQAVLQVQRAIDAGYRPVVVVSAMGRRGEPYATDSLLDLALVEHADLPARELDLLLSCGEVLSSVVFVGTLAAAGIAATALTGGQAGIITDAAFGEARIVRVQPEMVLQALDQGRVPVVAGFQGVTPEHEITTLGRGGSDTTAAALGSALRAEVVEIYTDVDGVKTADPRIVPEARTLAVSTYDEICQMAHSGARVVHPQAVEIAMQRGIPLRVRSTFAAGPGTLVGYSSEAAGPAAADWRGGPVTGVTHVPSLAWFELQTPAADAGSALFRALAEAGISLDLISVGPQRTSFCVDERSVERALRVLNALGVSARTRRGCAKVSVVGSGMRGQPGIMARVVEGLHAGGVEILQTADSHVTISCLVRAEQMEKAVRVLHAAFALGGAQDQSRN